MKSEAEEVVLEASQIQTRTDEIRARNRELIHNWKVWNLDFLEKISSFSRFGKNAIDAAILETSGYENTDSEVLKATFFTERHRYTITAKVPGKVGSVKADEGYLGLTASCRKSRAGEDWTRGCDLADGAYTDATWQRILCDIVGYELVRLGK